MKEVFREKRFSSTNATLVERAEGVVREYMGMDINITLRQLYYQLVSRGIIPNRQREYDRLGRLITDARYCGLIDWAAIEDRVRVPRYPQYFTGIPHIVRVAINSYALDRWQNQSYYLELFCEKDALSSVLAPIAAKWQVTFCVNRGYASATAIYDTAKRFEKAFSNGKPGVLLYLGDHDPSGLDMIRDISDRVHEIQQQEDYAFEVKHLALTKDQIEEYNPPPNPAKLTDSRAENYIQEHGEYSWEVDALPPDALQNLVENAIKENLDLAEYDDVKQREEDDKKTLKAFAAAYGKRGSGDNQK